MSTVHEIASGRRRRMALTIGPAAVGVLAAGVLVLAGGRGVGWTIVGVLAVAMGLAVGSVALGLEYSVRQDAAALAEADLDSTLAAAAGSCGESCDSTVCGTGACPVQTRSRA